MLTTSSATEWWTPSAERQASRSRLYKRESSMSPIPAPPAPAPIYRHRYEPDLVSSSRDCLERSRKLLTGTNDMVDPLRAGIPLARSGTVKPAQA